MPPNPSVESPLPLQIRLLQERGMNDSFTGLLALAESMFRCASSSLATTALSRGMQLHRNNYSAGNIYQLKW